jgi:hypothetical protein
MSDIINPNAPTDEIVARLLQFADQTDHYATPSIWRIAAYRLQKTERERAALAEAAKRKMEEPWRAKVDRLYTHCNDPDQRTLWSKSDIIELVESAIRIPPETPPAQGKEEAKQGDGSGTIKWDTGGPAARCPGCTACKPEPKDGAEEVVGPGVYYFGPDGTGAGNGTAIDITPNPRADREKQAARPARNMTTEEMAKILDHRSDVSNDLFAAIARRLRLLEAVAMRADKFIRADGRSDPPARYKELKDARAALDADEIGGKAT